MVYRDTLIAATGCSHLQLMMGRHIHTTLSTLSTALQPRWPNPDLVRQKDFDTKLSYRRNYDRHHEVCPESPGDTVRVRTDNEKSWTNTGVITNRADTPRSYTVQTESDMYRRNRRHLSVVPLSPIKLPRVTGNQSQLRVVSTEIVTGEVPLNPSPVSANPVLRRSVRSIIRFARLIEE